MGTTRYVAISAPHNCGLFCLGIFDDHRTAVGEVMDSVWELKDCYRDEGDTFEYDDFEEMEGEGGLVMTVKYKDKSWDKAEYDYYYLLFDRDETT